MKQNELRQMIREELLREGKAADLLYDVIDFVRAQVKKRKLTDDEVADFHEKIKKWIIRGF